MRVSPRTPVRVACAKAICRDEVRGLILTQCVIMQSVAPSQYSPEAAHDTTHTAYVYCTALKTEVNCKVYTLTAHRPGYTACYRSVTPSAPARAQRPSASRRRGARRAKVYRLPRRARAARRTPPRVCGPCRRDAAPRLAARRRRRVWRLPPLWRAYLAPGAARGRAPLP